VDPHRLAELRSIAYHRLVGERLRVHRDLIEAARARLDVWEREGRCAPACVDRWRRKLMLPIDELVTFLAADDDEGRELRQSTPFAGLLDPRERWALWRRVASDVEGRGP
jgi:hypothetical protein